MTRPVAPVYGEIVYQFLISPEEAASAVVIRRNGKVAIYLTKVGRLTMSNY